MIRLRRHSEGRLAVFRDGMWLITSVPPVTSYPSWFHDDRLCSGPGWSELLVAALPEPDRRVQNIRMVWTLCTGELTVGHLDGELESPYPHTVDSLRLGDRPICQCHTPEDASRIVAAVNARSTTAEPPPDERDALLSEIEQLRAELDEVAHSARELKRMHDECHQQRDVARAELARLHSWNGLMSLLDEHYPADIFIGSSGDHGPRVVALIREIDSLRETIEILSDPEEMAAIREGQAASAAGDVFTLDELKAKLAASRRAVPNPER